MLCVFSLIKQCVSLSFHLLQERALRWIKPVTTSFVLGTLADLTRGKAELLAENALLRHGSANRRCMQESRGFRLKRSA